MLGKKIIKTPSQITKHNKDLTNIKHQKQLTNVNPGNAVT